MLIPGLKFFAQCRSFSFGRSTGNKVPVLWNTGAEEGAAVITVQVLSWGRGSSGQLGGGTEETWLYPSPIATLVVPSTSSLCQSVPGRLPRAGSDCDSSEDHPHFSVSCGLFHSALLVGDKVWVWGKGDGGRLGLGHEDTVFVPTLNPLLVPVRTMALGGLHSVAMTSLGEVFTWGYGGFGALGHSVYHRELVPRLVNGPWDRRISHIATAGTHTVAITESGELYSWGRDKGDGRLGLGPDCGPNEGGGLSVPSKVKTLPIPVAAACCGGFFTMALTEQGQLWNWGANSNYELGRGDRNGGWRPQPVLSLEITRVIQIACGGYHSLALTENGQVLSWGYGGHGQLGHSTTESKRIPTVIDALANEVVVFIACGGSSSAAVTDKGKLYMWGNSKDSQLGTPGLPVFQTYPAEVVFLFDDADIRPYKVLQVAVGTSHAMCLVLRG